MKFVGMVKKEFWKCRTILREATEKGYVSPFVALQRWFLPGGRGNTKISFADLKKMKRSDTLVILGSGPSFARVNASVAQVLHDCDTFGMNFSFLNPNIVPKFQIISYESEEIAKRVLSREVRRHSQALAPTVFLVSDKMLWRFGHPRIMREFYPDNPIWCSFALPRNYSVGDQGGGFTDDRFSNTLVYRGTLTVVLDLIKDFGYKKIVLTGVDPFSNAHFFDDVPDMEDYIEHYKARFGGASVYESMVPKKGKELTIDLYLRALQAYMWRKYGTRLCTLFSDDQLVGILPPSNLV